MANGQARRRGVDGLAEEVRWVSEVVDGLEMGDDGRASDNNSRA